MKFAEYILKEEDFRKKLEIMQFVSKKAGLLFDNSVIFKATIVKLFVETMNLNVDKNLTITASLLCACKKINNAQDKETITNYAKKSAEFLYKLGFSERFCKICLEHNRYNESSNREPESDILELADQFGGMMLDRPERRGFPIDEAIVLLEHRNLKEYTNVFLEDFKKFIELEKEIVI